ncbi:CASP-like protein 5B2 [Impatiens glandulifera]|uniref:CASP-like protein 5B2 n=1 Tax=Impatiens glandulifera TaxID=253017 RepID=UPI001FB08886|nr:CASP-like protein 5B2 [Impatiens glandulifera]XP_047332974.1 CASP-like protein 5B2 [Impatiens glandulifera]
MKDLLGSPGTKTGLFLRISQCLFAVASIWVMTSAANFTSYTAFCYLIASMGLQLLWSLVLAGLDGYALWIKIDIHSPVLVSLFVVGDWVTATLSLAAACSSAGIAILYAGDLGFCKHHTQMQTACLRYQISVAFAFVTWFLIAISSCVMFWLNALLWIN